MSDQQVPPTTPGGGGQGTPGQGGQPSEEEIRAYLSQLRQADVGEIVAQTFNMLASGAQAKLGRRDGRLLIDLADAIAETAGDRLEDEVAEQIDQALSQLRMAQVDAEKELDEMKADGEVPQTEPGDLDASTPEPPPDEQSGTSGGSQLWTPG